MDQAVGQGKRRILAQDSLASIGLNAAFRQGEINARAITRDTLIGVAVQMAVSYDQVRGSLADEAFFGVIVYLASLKQPATAVPPTNAVDITAIDAEADEVDIVIVVHKNVLRVFP